MPNDYPPIPARYAWLTATLILLILAFFALRAHAATITLEWTPNTETDLGGYQVWRSLKACDTEASLQAFKLIDKGLKTWQDTTIPDGTTDVCYGLKAYDTSQNFSPMSNLAGKQLIRPTPTLLGHWDKKTDVPHDPSQNLKRYTIHAVVRPKAALVGFNPILVKNYTFFFYASVKGYCGDGGVLAGHGSTGRICDPTPLPALAWTALTATYDGTTLALFKDGQPLKSGPQAPPADSTDLLQIAGSKFNETCNCDLEVWLYDQAMTPTEVAALPKAPEPPVLQATPSTLAFTSQLGAADPAAQTITLTNVGGGVLDWQASATPAWLTIAPMSGTGPGTITVHASSSTLAPGTHLGSVEITLTGGATTSIPVTYTVQPDNAPPTAPTDLRVADRPTAGTITIQWAQAPPLPDGHRVDRLNQSTGAWIALTTVLEPSDSATVPLAARGRRIYRVCGQWPSGSLCNDQEGIWATR